MESLPDSTPILPISQYDAKFITVFLSLGGVLFLLTTITFVTRLRSRFLITGRLAHDDYWVIGGYVSGF